ncbi:MAG: hypothetical protein ABSE90_11045 [Verrucomicrobiota bacterium]
MNTVSDLGLDLDKLFQPAWAQGKTEANRFEKFTGNEGVKPERRFSDKPGERRGPRREGGGGFGGGGERRGGPPRGGSKFGDRKGGFGRRDDRRGERRERPEPPAPLPEITTTFLPDENGVESLARQIKMTGRAYPLFDIARLILQKPERYSVKLTVQKKPDGAVAQPLFVCALDETPWLSEDEAVAHVLKNHFATFYLAERTAIEPPKGKYTFVGQCGLSGVILGPPNHHDYQNQLRKLHTERFSRMPFDVFKSRVKIVKDEAVVKKWVEEQSFKTEYTVLNVPEPLKLPSLEEVEKHFRAVHKETIIKSVESHTVAGVPSRSLRCRELQRLVRNDWERQCYFPLQLATRLSQMFAGLGLQFFKVNKTVTHVGVARPLFLDLETTPVSDGIKRIVNFINANPKCTRKKLIEALAPTPKPAVSAPATPAPAAPAAEAPGGSTPTPNEPAALPVADPTPEQTLVLVDLHWLIHSGAVLEFADGRMDTAKKPLPRPVKQEKKKAEEKPAAGGEATVATETVPPAEGITESAAEISAPAKTVAEPPTVETPDPVEPAAPATETPVSSETISPVAGTAPVPKMASPSEEVPSPS